MGKRAIVVCHRAPARAPYAILPYGLYCNRKLQEAQEGDVIEFRQGDVREKRILVRRCKIAVRTSAFVFMMQSIYGKYMRTDELIRHWETWADVNGMGKQGFDHESMMLIEVKKFEKY